MSHHDHGGGVGQIHALPVRVDWFNSMTNYVLFYVKVNFKIMVSKI